MSFVFLNKFIFLQPSLHEGENSSALSINSSLKSFFASPSKFSNNPGLINLDPALVEELSLTESFVKFSLQMLEEFSFSLLISKFKFNLGIFDS